EGAGVGKCRGGDEAAKVGAGFEFVGERRDEFDRGRLLHEADKRFERAEVEGVGCVGGAGTESGGESEFGRQAVADRGDQHAATDIRQEFTTSVWSIHFILSSGVEGFWTMARS